jgi:hypothetical protein
MDLKTMVSKEQLDAAVASWETARDKSMLEQNAWGILNQSHSTLISSMRLHGHTWTHAQAEFDKLSQAHRDSLVAAWKAMDERCREYQDLLQRFKNQ